MRHPVSGRGISMLAAMIFVSQLALFAAEVAFALLCIGLVFTVSYHPLLDSSARIY